MKWFSETKMIRKYWFQSPLQSGDHNETITLSFTETKHIESSYVLVFTMLHADMYGFLSFKAWLYEIGTYNVVC